MKPTLFLIHFAGGNCYSYQAYLQYLQAFNVIRLELPGRGKRQQEPLLRDCEGAVQDLLSQIQKAPNLSDYAIYGHSMGAILGFRVAGLLAELQLPPLCLVISGNAGPEVVRQKNTRLFELPRAAFIEEVLRMGGTSEALFQVADIFEYFEPILRADFQIVETAPPLSKHQVLQLPIFAAMGDMEPFSEQIANWERYTALHFRSKIFSGHHFFINDDPAGICRFILDAYDCGKSMQHR